MIFEVLIAKGTWIRQLGSYDWSAAEHVSNTVVLMALTYVLIRYILFVTHNLVFDRQGRLVAGKYTPKVLQHHQEADHLTLELALYNFSLAYVYEGLDGQIYQEKCLSIFGQENVFEYVEDIPTVSIQWYSAWWLLFLPAPLGFGTVFIYVALTTKLGLALSPKLITLPSAAFMSGFWYLWLCCGLVGFLEGQYNYDPSKFTNDQSS
jgi:hypothetical protein